MVYLIGGPSHTGKTVLARRMVEAYHYNCLSIDHLKMGLIRSGHTALTPMDDRQLTGYLWPIVREMAKTAIENRQNLILEGCYIPYNWKNDFPDDYLDQIRCCFLILSEDYIRSHFDDIRAHAGDIEQRQDDSGLSVQWLVRENREALAQCQKYGCCYQLIQDTYHVALL